jgi:hypothetical protein
MSVTGCFARPSMSRAIRGIELEDVCAVLGEIEQFAQRVAHQRSSAAVSQHSKNDFWPPIL